MAFQGRGRNLITFSTQGPNCTWCSASWFFPHFFKSEEQFQRMWPKTGRISRKTSSFCPAAFWPFNPPQQGIVTRRLTPQSTVQGLHDSHLKGEVKRLTGATSKRQQMQELWSPHQRSPEEGKAAIHKQGMVWMLLLSRWQQLLGAETWLAIDCCILTTVFRIITIFNLY